MAWCCMQHVSMEIGLIRNCSYKNVWSLGRMLLEKMHVRSLPSLGMVVLRSSHLMTTWSQHREHVRWAICSCQANLLPSLKPGGKLEPVWEGMIG